MTADAERRTAAIMYAELRNFTRLSEVLPPEKVLELANDFFSFCAMAVTANKGKVLSVQNDALLGAFGTGAAKDFAERSVKAARDLQREFGALGEQWKTQYGLPAAVSCAVHLGEAVFGHAGPIGARQFVAFGDCVSIPEPLLPPAPAGAPRGPRRGPGETILSAAVVRALGRAARSLGAKPLPPLELVKRPSIPLYG